jgi:hypothetical protein
MKALYISLTIFLGTISSHNTFSVNKNQIDALVSKIFESKAIVETIEAIYGSNENGITTAKHDIKIILSENEPICQQIAEVKEISSEIQGSLLSLISEKNLDTATIEDDVFCKPLKDLKINSLGRQRKSASSTSDDELSDSQ